MNQPNLKHEFSFLRKILNQLTYLPSMILDKTGRVLFFSTGSGYTGKFNRDEIEGDHVSQIMPGKSRKSATQTLLSQRDRGEASVVAPLKTNKGKTRVFLWEVLYTEAPEGEKKLAVCIGKTDYEGGINKKDVKKEFEAARETAKKYRTLFEYAYDAILFSGFESGRIFEANPESANLLGYKTEELLDKNFADLLVSEKLESIKENLSKNRFSYKKQQELRTKSGSRKVASMSSSLIEYQGKKTILTLFHDMTERAKLEEKLRERAESLKESNEQLEEIIHILSHDLKEPLRSIGTYSDMLFSKCKEDLDPASFNRLKKLKQNSAKLKNMLDNVSNLSKVSVGGAPEVIDVEGLIEQIKGELTVNLGEATVKVETGFPEVKFDRFQLKVLLRNAISNSIKYNSPPKRVKVGYKKREENSDLTIFVEDNGQGIEEEYRDRVFDMFEQLDPEKGDNGMGAGLAFCKKIVQSHGGSISLESDLGEGTTLYFTLPQKKVN